MKLIPLVRKNEASLRIGKYIQAHISSSVLTFPIFVLPFMVAFQSRALWFVSDFLHKAPAFLFVTSWCTFLLWDPEGTSPNQQWLLTSWSRCMWRLLLIKWLVEEIFFLLAGKDAWWVGVWQGLHLECLHTHLIEMHKSNIMPITAPGWVVTSQRKEDFSVPVSTQFLSVHLRADSWHQLKPPSFHKPSSWICFSECAQSRIIEYSELEGTHRRLMEPSSWLCTGHALNGGRGCLLHCTWTEHGL